jgi:translation initiation factor IF-3
LIRKFKHQQEKRYRINQRIFASSLRILDSESKQIGVMSKDEALKLAQEQGLDLVEIAPLAKPPVAKIIDYNKFLYQQEKKKKEEKKKAKTSETKEIRLGPFMSDNDLQVMIRRGREFLEDGHKVRTVVKFRGRQITRPEFGKVTVGKFIEALSDISKVDRDPHFEGKQLISLLSPDKGAQAKKPSPPASVSETGAEQKQENKEEQTHEKNEEKN